MSGMGKCWGKRGNIERQREMTVKGNDEKKVINANDGVLRGKEIAKKIMIYGK